MNLLPQGFRHFLNGILTAQKRPKLDFGPYRPVDKANSMSVKKNFPTRLAAGLLLAILIDTALQLVWKTAVLSLPNNGSPWLNVPAVLHSPLFIFVIFLSACQFFNWLMGLKKADLSVAQPVTSLSEVTVLCLARLYVKDAS